MPTTSRPPAASSLMAKPPTTTTSGPAAGNPLPNRSQPGIANASQRHRDHANSTVNANLAPPSTLAAQLIYDVAAGKSPSQFTQRGRDRDKGKGIHCGSRDDVQGTGEARSVGSGIYSSNGSGSGDDFQTLLNEVSTFVDQGPETPLEERLTHHQKLIYVISKAVLDVLPRDDPFLQKHKLLGQAGEALDVLIATIRETPVVLEREAGISHLYRKEMDVQEGSDVPVWMWIFAKVLLLAGREGCESIQSKMIDFFSAVFEAITRTPQLWRLTGAMFSYLRDCADATMSRLADLAVISPATPLCLPPSLMEERLYLPTNIDHAKLGSSTYTLTTVPQAIEHVHSILSILTQRSMLTAALSDPSITSEDYVCWMIEARLLIVDTEQKWRTEPALRKYLSAAKDLTDAEHERQQRLVALVEIHLIITTLDARVTTTLRRKAWLSIVQSLSRLLDSTEDLSDTESSDSKPASWGALPEILLDLAATARKVESIKRITAARLSKNLDALSKKEESSFGPDFMAAAILLRATLQNLENESSEALPSFQNEKLENKAIALNLVKSDVLTNSTAGAIRTLKRRRSSDKTNAITQLTDTACALLASGSEETATIAQIKENIELYFSTVDDETRCKALQYLCLLPCAAAIESGSFAISAAQLDIDNLQCPLCDNKATVTASSNDATTRSSSILRATNNVLVPLLVKLIDAPSFVGSRRPRVLAMLGLRRLAAHFKTMEVQDFETSVLGQWCLKSLQSSVRELRIAAGRTLPTFVTNSASDEVLSKNWDIIFGLLRSSSTRPVPLHLLETNILAWVQLGRVAKGENLKFVLHQLVEYLGHTNLIASGVAFNELLNLSASLGLSPAQLFAPFWQSIAVAVVLNLQSKPQTAQYVADLMGYSVDHFLVSTQSYTLPSLVLQHRKELILRITKLNNQEDPCTLLADNINLTPILALLLVQPVPAEKLETFIMSLLRSISVRFKETDLTELLHIEPVALAFELFKVAGEESGERKQKVLNAIGFLSENYTRDSENVQAGKSKLDAFLEMHVLGLLARFLEPINDLRLDISAKQRCLKGLEEMILMGKGLIRSALRQICGGLQSALSQAELRPNAFSAWATMIMNFDDVDVYEMLESTFATIILYYDSFTPQTKSLAGDVITHLLSKRQNMLKENIDVIPSLGHIPEFTTFESELKKMRTGLDMIHQYQAYDQRIRHENEAVVKQALTELAKYLRTNQAFIQASAVSEQPDKIVGQLIRSIIDACVKFNGSSTDIARLSAECIGLIGCLDPNRVEAVRETHDIVVVSNFEEADETTDFVLFLLQEVLVKAFLSATNPRAQGFLSFAMQELLEKCDISSVYANRNKGRGNAEAEALYEKWLALPESVRVALTPFLTSRYVMTELNVPEAKYPIYAVDKKFTLWIKTLVLDVLQKPHNENARLIFSPICRVIRSSDTSVSSFMLPIVVLHAIASGSDKQRADLLQELLTVLQQKKSDLSHADWESLRLCSESVFNVLDYLSRWVQESQTKLRTSRGYDPRTSAGEFPSTPEIQRVSSFLAEIPAHLISTRAVECKSFARALFHWEQHIRQSQQSSGSQRPENLELRRLQEIYTEIDEPDGIDGLAAHLDVLDIDQQVLGHKKAGRWSAAQNWYEIKLAEEPESVELQVSLLTCLKESSQHDVLLNYVEGMHKSSVTMPQLLPFITEACWATYHWDTLEKYLSTSPHDLAGDFNVSVGQVLLALHKNDRDKFDLTIKQIREHIASSLSLSTTLSLNSCHDVMLKFHVLSEIEIIATPIEDTKNKRRDLIQSLDRRLEVIGSYLSDKQYLLSIRRAVMNLCSPAFSKEEVASTWLTSARLSRKENEIHQSFNAVLHASQLCEESATIEHARLLWKEGHSRQAIQTLQGALNSSFFKRADKSSMDAVNSVASGGIEQKPGYLAARAHLLLAKWLDSAGQTHSSALRSQYQLAAKTFPQWEKGHYYLGRHYNKLLETDRALAPEHQAHTYLTGETAKLVIENYLRSLSYGTKYIYQTLPRIFTLWLNLGSQVNQQIDPKLGFSKEFISRITAGRKEQLQALHGKIAKYIQKIPAYMFYTALPQIVARITHPNAEVYKYLQQILVKVVSSFPQQALWSLLAVSTSMQQDRKARGCNVLAALRNLSKKSDVGSHDLRTMIKLGEKLSDQLLTLCNAGEFSGNRTYRASLTRDLGFNQKGCTPNPLAVPVETTLTATLPTLTDNVRSHKAFSRDVVTISSFLDDVLVLSSLQKPRKITARGSDGRVYGLLCKPKDDLRKDQRLMEFNGMINRYLKRDAESSKRQLYIKTYAVTPLNEECGIIEWVDGLKTLRDILLGLYKAKGISPNYGEIKQYLDQACVSEDKLPLFTEKVLGNFPPVFHEWFVQQFPEPSAWFTARLKYTRSCAVMSMVGTILGLGDRHGENILFEEGNGGTFHVDFNCLFDKGLTFAQPERVPFRLTHNMVDAMGVYGYEGPFRKSSELTLALLRQHEETLMTVLEAFVYDPTLDLLAKTGKKRKDTTVPDTPQGVLDSIRRKVRGLLAGESLPLGVEGQVDELIKQAVSPKNLAAMYIGWCAFF